MRKPLITRIGIVAAVCGAVLLSGCSTTGGTGPDASGVTEVTLFWKGSERPGIEAAVAEYNKLNSDVKVTVTTAETEQYYGTLRTQLSANTASDIIFVWPGDGNPGSITQLSPGGYLEDLSDQPWVDKLPPSLADLVALKGKTYLLPVVVTSFGPWYNQKVLDETGITPPSKWSEVLQYCADARAAGKTPYSVGGQVLNASQNMFEVLKPDLLYGPDRDLDESLASGKTTFSSNEGWNTALDHYQQMIDAHCFTDGVLGVSQDEQNRALASGDAIAMPGLGFQLANTYKFDPNADIRLYPLSSDDDPDTNLMTVGNAGGAAVNVKSPHKEQAKAFLQWLAGADGMTIYADALGAVIPSISTGKQLGKNQEIMNEYLVDDRAVHLLNQAWPGPRVEQAAFAGFQGMLSGTTTPADVLKSMDAEYEAARKG